MTKNGIYKPMSGNNEALFSSLWLQEVICWHKIKFRWYFSVVLTFFNGGGWNCFLFNIILQQLYQMCLKRPFNLQLPTATHEYENLKIWKNSPERKAQPPSVGASDSRGLHCARIRWQPRGRESFGEPHCLIIIRIHGLSPSIPHNQSSLWCTAHS